MDGYFRRGGGGGRNNNNNDEQAELRGISRIGVRSSIILYKECVLE